MRIPLLIFFSGIKKMYTMIEFLRKIFSNNEGSFDVSLNEKGEYYFKLRASNGEIVLISESYKNRRGCENGIESVKENSKLEENFEIRLSKDNKRYFVLKAKNNEIIGMSEMYNSLRNTLKGIESVRRFSKTEKIRFV